MTTFFSKSMLNFCQKCPKNRAKWPSTSCYIIHKTIIFLGCDPLDWPSTTTSYFCISGIFIMLAFLFSAIVTFKTMGNIVHWFEFCVLQWRCVACATRHHQVIQNGVVTIMHASRHLEYLLVAIHFIFIQHFTSFCAMNIVACMCILTIPLVIGFIVVFIVVGFVWFTFLFVL